MLSKILEKFVDNSPITVMAQTLMNRIFTSDNLDHLFEKYAVRQYQQDLLFSSLADLNYPCLRYDDLEIDDSTPLFHLSTVPLANPEN